MHADLVAISNVWQADVVADTLRAEHEQLVAAVKSAQAALAAADAEVTRTKAQADQAHAALRATNRELDEYVTQRDRTRKMIETGAAPDYAAAERQLAKCIAIVDELETRGLEQIEAEETARAAAAAALDSRGKAAAALDEARAALGARDAPIRAELTDALHRREAAWGLLPQDLRSPYQELRRRNKKALVNTVEGICQQCQMRVAPNRVNEVALGKAVHSCPGCHAYLLP